MHQGQLQNQQTVSYLQSKYLSGRVSLPVVIETIKQKILAYSNKPRQYIVRVLGNFRIIKDSSMRLWLHLTATTIKLSHVLLALLMRFLSSGIHCGEIKLLTVIRLGYQG